MVSKKPMAKVIKDWWNSQDRRLRYFMASTLVVIILFILLIIVFQIYFDMSNNFITKAECGSLMIKYHLEYSNYTFWQSFLLEYKPIIILLSFSIALAWIIHGFQLRLLA